MMTNKMQMCNEARVASCSSPSAGGCDALLQTDKPQLSKQTMIARCTFMMAARSGSAVPSAHHLSR